MKQVLGIVVGSLIAFSAVAADEQEQNVYASQLCHIVGGETATGSADQYVDKMKAWFARSQSSTAVTKPEFDEETAREVINGWLQLGDDERSALRGNEQRCEQTVMTQFQQED